MTTTESFVFQRLLDITPEYTVEDIMDIVPALFSTKTLLEMAEEDSRDRAKSRAAVTTPSLSGKGQFISIMQPPPPQKHLKDPQQF